MTATADALMAIFGFKRVEGSQMKTHRELLELAAKAAGVSFFVDGLGRCMEMHDNLMPCPWNPLTDDGDALRLAVKLGIDIDFYRRTVGAWRIDIGSITEPYHECASQATRRAIVRAAAAIGEGMQ